MSSDFPVPQSLGPFDLHELLGSNGLLFTLSATHRSQGFGAIVTAAPEQEVEASTVERYEQEAARMAGGKFQRLIPPFQWGREEGWLWLASPRYDGDHIGRHMRTSGLPPAGLSLELCRQAALGLEELKTLGMCHGAISPATVFVDNAAQVFLLHTPWSHLIPGLEGGYLHPALMSVLPFTAPEVAANAMPTPAGDAWSLGAILYFLLLGRPAHWADDPQSLLTALQNDPVDLAPLGEVAPPAAVELVDELLSREPEDRPVNWPAVAQRLGVLSAELGFSPTPPAPPAPAPPSPASAPSFSPEASAAPLAPELPPPLSAGPPKAKEVKAAAKGLSAAPIPVYSPKPAATPPPAPAPELISTGGGGAKTVLLVSIIVGVLVLGAGGGLLVWKLLASSSSSSSGASGKKSAGGAVAKPEADPKYTSTGEAILAVGQLVQTHKLVKRSWPKSFEDLKTKAPLDAWGTPLEIREGFVISAGEDKKWDTRDDLYYDPEAKLLGGPTKKVGLSDEVLAPEAPAAPASTRKEPSAVRKEPAAPGGAQPTPRPQRKPKS